MGTEEGRATVTNVERHAVLPNNKCPWRGRFGRLWRRRWSGVPRGIVLAVVAEALLLAYGGGVHLLQLTAGWPPYPWAPAWLAAYFISLNVLDPLAAFMLLIPRSMGLYLAAFILITDAGANWYAGYCLSQGTMTARIAAAVICCLALGSLAIAHQARPWMRQHRSTANRPSC